MIVRMYDDPMPTLTIPDGFCQITHVFTLTGDLEPMVITMGAFPDAGDPPDDTAMNTIHDAAATNILAMMGTGYSIVRTEAHGKDTGGGEYVVVHNEVVASPNGGGACPQNVACLVHKRTGLAGRHQRGRFYVPGPTEGDVGGNGALVAGYITANQPRLNTYLAAYSTAGQWSAPVLFHADPSYVPTTITTLTLDPVVATQRRRLRR